MFDGNVKLVYEEKVSVFRFQSIQKIFPDT